MSFILSLVLNSLEQVGLSLLHNWPYLLVGILIAALLKCYVDAERVSSFLLRFRGMGVVTATLAAVTTPLCSCGTTAVVLGMMASTLPWAPIVAFMVSSPLTSPEELFYSAGLFGWPFAVAFFSASIFLGLLGGAVAAMIENKGWLKNQTRFANPRQDTGENLLTIHQMPATNCECDQPEAIIQPSANVIDISPLSACACSQPQLVTVGDVCPAGCEVSQPPSLCACETSTAITAPVHLLVGSEAYPILSVIGRNSAEVIRLLREIYNSARQLLPMFLGFAFIGYFLNGLIPSGWISTLFGGGNIYGVPLAATLGLPLYINTEGSLPLVRALLDSGMSQGAALAFLIAGAGTSFGAMAGALTIARWRVVALVIGMLWLGAILSGYVYDLLLILKFV